MHRTRRQLEEEELLRAEYFARGGVVTRYPTGVKSGLEYNYWAARKYNAKKRAEERAKRKQEQR